MFIAGEESLDQDLEASVESPVLQSNEPELSQTFKEKASISECEYDSECCDNDNISSKMNISKSKYLLFIKESLLI